MEFNEKLQELRKRRSLTQEELAEALFVSRTAISKWESGRGYPSIDSLKEISRFFSVSIDELICSEEILSVAENERKEYVDGCICLACDLLDILLAVLLFIPVFGNGNEPPSTVSLPDITGTSPGIRIVFAVVICIMVLNGILGLAVSRFFRTLYNRRRPVMGMFLSIIAVLVFIAARQPYAGFVCFVLLVIKATLFMNHGFIESDKRKHENDR